MTKRATEKQTTTTIGRAETYFGRRWKQFLEGAGIGYQHGRVSILTEEQFFALIKASEESQIQALREEMALKETQLKANVEAILQRAQTFAANVVEQDSSVITFQIGGRSDYFGVDHISVRQSRPYTSAEMAQLIKRRESYANRTKNERERKLRRQQKDMQERLKKIQKEAATLGLVLIDPDGQDGPAMVGQVTD